MKDNLTFSYYLVVFIDLLGQRETLRKITSLPTSESEKQEFIRLIKESLGSVDFIRELFQSYFDAYSSEDTNDYKVPPQYRELFVASLKSEAYYYSISDSIIIAVPLTNKNENCTAANGIFSALLATCGIGVGALSSKIVMRGGIDVGIATQIDDKEIYGPALERAYHLESTLAEYPRFIVGKELLEYLDWIKNQQTTTPFGLIAKEIAGVCKRMLILDTDGRPMLDFLGSIVKSHSENVIDKEMFTSARDFVVSQHGRFAGEGNVKLASYYYRLISYIRSRQAIWGIE